MADHKSLCQPLLPFGREVSRVLIKRPTRLGPPRPGRLCVCKHSGTVHQQPGHLTQGPTRTRRYEAACAQAIGTLRAIGWLWQGSHHPSVTTRNGAIMNMLKITPPVTDWAAAWN